MEKANINKTIDTKYKNGFVKCKCGWTQELGNGFNQHYIDNCPACTKELKTRNQRKVTYGARNNLTVEIGNNIYFVLSNGIHLRYSKQIFSTHTGLSERQADKL